MKLKILAFVAIMAISVIGQAESASVLIPKQTLAKIKADAAKDYPDDYVTQEFVINMQTKAYYEAVNYKNKKVPKKVLNKIKKGAKSDYPNDYVTQIFIIETQCQSYINLN